MKPIDTLLPLLGVTAYFLGALAIYHVRLVRGWQAYDPEVESRPASVVLGRYWRNYIMWVLSPYERLLVRLPELLPGDAPPLSSTETSGQATCCFEPRAPHSWIPHAPTRIARWSSESPRSSEASLPAHSAHTRKPGHCPRDGETATGSISSTIC